MVDRELPPEVIRVKNWLETRHFNPRIRWLTLPAHTAADAAKAVNCCLGEIAKSLVFYQVGDRRPVLIIVSGTNQVNKDLVSQFLERKIKTADPEYVLEVTGFPVGGVPPVAHTQNLRTLIDRDLFRYRRVWVAAGHPSTLFSISPDRLVRLTRAEAISVT